MAGPIYDPETQTTYYPGTAGHKRLTGEAAEEAAAEEKKDEGDNGPAPEEKAKAEELLEAEKAEKERLEMLEQAPVLKEERGVKSISDPKTGVVYYEGTKGYRDRITGPLRIEGQRLYEKTQRARGREATVEEIITGRESRVPEATLPKTPAWFKPFKSLRRKPGEPAAIERIVFEPERVVLVEEGAEYYRKPLPLFQDMRREKAPDMYHPVLGKLIRKDKRMLG